MPKRSRKRGSQKPRPGRGADQGKFRDLQLHRPSRRPLTDEDIDVKILHGRIEDLLDDMGQAVDLIDEKDILFVQVRQDGRQITRSSR